MRQIITFSTLSHYQIITLFPCFYHRCGECFIAGLPRLGHRRGPVFAKASFEGPKKGFSDVGVMFGLCAVGHMTSCQSHNFFLQTVQLVKSCKNKIELADQLAVLLAHVLRKQAPELRMLKEQFAVKQITDHVCVQIAEHTPGVLYQCDLLLGHVCCINQLTGQIWVKAARKNKFMLTKRIKWRVKRRRKGMEGSVNDGLFSNGAFRFACDA